MLLEAIATLLFGGLFIRWGWRLGHRLVQRGATANDLFFKDNPILACIMIGTYVALIVVALNLPQSQVFPLEWRVYGMQITWTIMRVMLLGFCGLAWAISWHTARIQVIAIALLAVLGLGGFTATERYFLAPIYTELRDDWRAPGVFKQSFSSSCAPASLATVLRQWGVDATESGVAKLAGTSRMGTSMPQLIVAARELGMDGIELHVTWDQMWQINRPGVLSVWQFAGLRKLPHAVAVVAMDRDWAAIADPAPGKILLLNRAQLARIWRDEYVPIFRPHETDLSPDQAIDYLKRLGYITNSFTDWRAALRQFQIAMDIDPTGELNLETNLLLMGSFLDRQQIPTLTPPPTPGQPSHPRPDGQHS